MISELPLACVLIVVLTVPGWAILSVNQEWRRWDTLQRWCLAIGISIAFYPVLFYATRFPAALVFARPLQASSAAVGRCGPHCLADAWCVA